jgi:hypothetical protein
VDFDPVLTLDGEEGGLDLSPVNLYRAQAAVTMSALILASEVESFTASDSFLPNRLWFKTRALFAQTLENPALLSWEEVPGKAGAVMRVYTVVARGRTAVNNAINPVVLRREMNVWRDRVRVAAA